MKYLFLMEIKVPDYEWFIELGKSYELNILPNITDTIWIDDCFCRIKEIIHKINDNEIWLKLTVEDPLHARIKNSDDAVDRLVEDIEEFKKYGWYLNDYDLNNYRVSLNKD